jgi:low affinity Fe/Cu permease
MTSSSVRALHGPFTVTHASLTSRWSRHFYGRNHTGIEAMSQSLFSRIANATARGVGKPAASILAVTAIVVWAATGPIFQFNETWQLVINTGTTIVTFLMVFLIQHTQNSDTAAVQIKLDELIRTLKKADNSLLDLEHEDVEELDRLQHHYAAKAVDAKNGKGAGKGTGDKEAKDDKKGTDDKA